MNTPGPFYTTRPDNAHLGPITAPDHVGFDGENYDVVFRQPLSRSDLEAILGAARFDAWGGYAADGNNYWTPAEVRAWWSRKPELLRHIESFTDTFPQHEFYRHVRDSWRMFLDDEAELYLRRYCYFLENGHWPSMGKALPDLLTRSR